MRRTTALVAIALGLLLLVGGTAPAATLKWTRVGATAANFGQPGLARTADGILHLVWVAINEADTNRRDLLHSTVSTAGVPEAAAPVQEAWSDINPVPDLVRTPDGGLRAFWGGIRSVNPGETNSFGVHTATAPASGAPWTLLSGVIARGSGEFGADTSATFAPDGTPLIVSGSAFVHRGLDPNTPNFDYDSGPDAYGANIATDPVTGDVWIVWFSQTMGTVGVVARQVDPATGAPMGQPIRMPGSFTLFNDQETASNPIARIPLVAHPNGGLYTAYVGGYPTLDKVLLWRVGDTTSYEVDTGADYLGAVAVSAAPNGQVWVVHARRASLPKVVAQVSNKNLTAWSPLLSLTAPSSVGDFASLYQIDADAGAGFADVFMNLSDGTEAGTSMWHSRFPAVPQWTDGNDVLTGTNSSDFIFGGSGNDRLSGRGGADQLFGGEGADTLDGGKGKDRLNGGPGRDKCFVTKGDKTNGCEVVRARRHI